MTSPLTLPREPTEAMVEAVAKAVYDANPERWADGEALPWMRLSEKRRARLAGEVRVFYASLVAHRLAETGGE